MKINILIKNFQLFNNFTVTKKNFFTCKSFGFACNLKNLLAKFEDLQVVYLQILRIF